MRLFAVTVAVLLGLTAPVAAQDQGWQRQGHTWTFTLQGQERLIVEIGNEVYPGEKLVEATSFSETGDPIAFVDVDYQGIDNVGITLEVRSVLANDALQRVYQDAYREFPSHSMARISVLFRARSVNSTIRLPTPPTSFRVLRLLHYRVIIDITESRGPELVAAVREEDPTRIP